MKYPNGDVYVGEWTNGLKSGFGRYKFAGDKSQLIGTWQHGRLKYGRWQLPSGIYYAGTFKRNKPFGKGVWVFPNGNQVIGEYVQKVRLIPQCLQARAVCSLLRNFDIRYGGHSPPLWMQALSLE